jgi:recombination protein RecA
MPPTTKQKQSAAARAREKFDAQFEKSYGEGTIDGSGEVVPYEVISTGSLSVDYSMGVGGYVEGRLYEIWGQDAIGKTTFALQGVREAQKKHPELLVAWIDMEHTFDRQWAITHGVNIGPNGMRIITPQSAEDVADQMKDCLRSGLFSMIVLDSIGAMIPEAEKEKDADQATMAIQAKIVTRMVKIAAVEADNTGTVVIMLNQVRANLSYGADTTTGGGFALKHVTTGKLKLSRGGSTPLTVRVPGEEKPVEVGYEVAIQNERNKVAPPKRRAHFVLLHSGTDKYGPVGIDRADEAVTVGIISGAIEQKGGWFTLPGEEKSIQGRPAVVDAVRGNEEMVQAIRTAALATVSEQIVVGESADPLADPETGEILAQADGKSIFSPLGSGD